MVRQERTAASAMKRAGQTPHGARPNREEARLRLGACRLGALAPPGRSLEPPSNVWPRGMVVLRYVIAPSRTSVHDRASRADRIRLTGPAALKIFVSNTSFTSPVIDGPARALPTVRQLRNREVFRVILHRVRLSVRVKFIRPNVVHLHHRTARQVKRHGVSRAYEISSGRSRLRAG